ncbi:uncharacterized protein LOC133533060 [Cydia pomonella]|uniref:uncharacterized protein LOC133533060 n=1 Tax=Cydia pomonella TaxID=82600 RepID=UPI002ADDE877|nr:uncharacterized protein LOC133533060 [Cydia pomonella]
MESVEERLNKARQERIAREKARIDKLRELNLKKYNKNESQSFSKAPSNASLANKTLNTTVKPKNDLPKSNLKSSSTIREVKKNFSINDKRPLTAPMPLKKPTAEIKPVMNSINPPKVTEVKNDLKMVDKSMVHLKNTVKKDFVNSNKIIANSLKLPVNGVKNVPNVGRKTLAPIKMANQLKLSENQSKTPEKSKEITRKSMLRMNQPFEKPNLTARKSMAPLNQSKISDKAMECSRKSMIPMRPLSVTKNRESVFDRLYKPKTVQKAELSDADRLQRDPIFLQKVLKQGSLIASKRHTIFGPNIAKPVTKDLVRRSISAVHLKRISKKELGNCFHKWSSIDEKLNEIDVTTTNEDDKVKQDTVTSAIKSERKRVRLQTPISFTPRPEEMRNRLQKWLQSRGKSIHSYQHLQCFGIHHLAEKPLKPLFLKTEAKEFDEENKENIELDHDSDNDSYTDCMNEPIDDNTKWRGRVSYVSDSVCMNDSDHDTTLNSDEAPVDDVLLGALNDLTELLREGFDWEQCARWLRAVRTRFPHAPSLAAYWECRAALEETRGDLPASVQCWEEAIAKGTQHSVVDANLDQLLDKFMQLKISPNSGKRDRVDPKLVDVKNVFKSTIIRFAVQQAKLRQSNQAEQPTHTVTPVRRSARLGSHRTNIQKTPRHQKTPKTPLQICSSIRQAGLIGEKVLFVPNTTLCNTP